MNLKEQIKTLRSERDRTRKATVEKALTGEPISEQIERLENYDKLIASCSGTSKHWLPALFIGAFCIIAVGVLLLIQISSVSVHASVETDSLTFEFGRAAIRLDGFTEIKLPPEFAPESNLQEQAWLDIDKAKTTASDLLFKSGARVSLLHAPQGAIHLLSVGAPFRGQIHALDTSVIKGGGMADHVEASKSVQFAVPATFPFYSQGAGVVPAQLRFSPGDKIVLRDIPIRALSFSREEAGFAVPPVYASGIASGKVTIGETGEKVTLDTSTQLQLDSLTVLIRELEMGPETFRLSLEGRAKNASVGTAGFQRDLVPSCLSYLFHQERLSFLWGSIVFLWSILWSARQLLFN
jgi:hypothetical protein